MYANKEEDERVSFFIFCHFFDESTSALQKGLSVIYLHFNGSHSAMRGAAMSVITAVSGFVLLTVTVVLGQYGWGVTYTSTPICAVKGSTVEIRCTYTYPSRQYNPYRVVRTFWLTKESNNEPVDLTTDPEYSGRVQYQCENNDCTLRITDLRESDSAEYKFMLITNDPGGKYTGSPGVTLTVTDLQVQVSRSAVRGDSKSADLKCESSCPLPDNLSYIWYKNKQIISEQTSNLYLNYWDPTNRISCAVRGYENSRTPSLVVKDVWDVTYTSTQVCAFKGSTAEIRCTFRYPSTINGRNTSIQKTFWFTKVKDNEPVDLTTQSEYRDRVHYQCKNNDCTLRITDLRESDSAEYKFKFITNHEGGKYSGVPGVSLTVTVPDPQLQVHVRRSTVNSYSNWTELTCHNNCQLPDQSSYIWYWNGHKLSSEKQYLHLNTFDSVDSFHCAVKGYEQFPSPTVYPPKRPSVSVSPSAEIVEGSSVTLTCSTDANPAANYTWYKENENLPKAFGQNFTVAKFRPEHSGSYYCEAQNKLGRHNSTLQLNIMPGAKKTKAAGVTAAVLLSVTFLPVLLWIRKKRNSKESSKLKGRADNKEQCLSDQEERQEQDDLQHASIHFSNNQADPLYTNSSSAPQTHGGTESYT